MFCLAQVYAPINEMSKFENHTLIRFKNEKCHYLVALLYLWKFKNFFFFSFNINHFVSMLDKHHECMYTYRVTRQIKSVIVHICNATPKQKNIKMIFFFVLLLMITCMYMVMQYVYTLTIKYNCQNDIVISPLCVQANFIR